MLDKMNSIEIAFENKTTCSSEQVVWSATD